MKKVWSVCLACLLICMTATAVLADEAASVYLQDPALLTAVNKGICGYEFYPVFAQDMSLVYYEKSNQ